MPESKPAMPACKLAKHTHNYLRSDDVAAQLVTCLSDLYILNQIDAGLVSIR